MIAKWTSPDPPGRPAVVMTPPLFYVRRGPDGVEAVAVIDGVEHVGPLSRTAAWSIALKMLELLREGER